MTLDAVLLFLSFMIIWIGGYIVGRNDGKKAGYKELMNKIDTKLEERRNEE